MQGEERAREATGHSKDAIYKQSIPLWNACHVWTLVYTLDASARRTDGAAKADLVTQVLGDRHSSKPRKVGVGGKGGGGAYWLVRRAHASVERAALAASASSSFAAEMIPPPLLPCMHAQL